MATTAAAGFSGWYSAEQITAWAARLASQMEALQRAQAQSTDAYLARATSSIVGGRIRPTGRVDVTDLRTGVTHAGAYARAADVYRWQQSQFDQFARVLAETQDVASLAPFDLVDPIDAAVQRVAAVADMDIQLADRAQSKRTLEDQARKVEIRGYRRVIHPELSKGGTCGLCIAASDRIYHVEDLKALHGRCECTVLPIVGQHDPGSSLNNLDLNDLYAHAGDSTNRADLKRTRYQIDQHGELGPVLTDGKFRTARQARRSTNGPGKAKTAVRAREDLDRLLSMEMGAQDKAHALAKADPGKWGKYSAALDARITDLRGQLAQQL